MRGYTNTYSYFENISVHYNYYLSGSGTLLWNHTRCLAKRDGKTRYAKKNGSPGDPTSDLILSGSACYLLTTRCLHTRCLTKSDENKRYTKKKNGSTLGIEPATHTLKTASYFFLTTRFVLHAFMAELSASIRTNRSSWYTVRDIHIYVKFFFFFWSDWISYAKTGCVPDSIQYKEATFLFSPKNLRLNFLIVIFLTSVAY